MYEARIRAAGTWPAWRGRIGPIAVAPADRILEAVHGPAAAVLGRIQEAGVGGLLLGDPARRPPERIEAFAQSALEHGLCLILELDLDRPASMPDRSPKLRLLFEALAARHPGLIAALPLPPDLDEEAFERRIEDGLHPYLRRLGVPLLVSSADPLGPNGALLRTAGLAVELTGTEMPAGAAGPAARLAPLLAARLPDRPFAVKLPAPDARAQPEELLVTALAAGAGLLVLPADFTPASLERLLAPVRALPRELPDRAPETAAVYLREFPAGIPHGAPPRALAGALELLHRAGVEAGFRPQTDPAAGRRPDLLWVPAHGPLPNEAWSLLWRLARAGTFVLVTGLTIDEALDRKRLELLGLPQEIVPAQRRAELPPWLRENRVLATGPQGLEARLDLGSILFLERCPELAAGEPHSLELVRRCLRRAGLRPAAAQPPDERPPFVRRLVTKDAAFEFDLDRASWRPAST